MKRTGKSKKDEVWLKKLGERIDSLIREKGYASPYDFWVQRAGDKVSRAALNYILTGKTDPKATTLKALADLLHVRVRDLMDLPD